MGKPEAALLGPWASVSRDDDEGFIEQDLGVEIALCELSQASRYQQVNFSILQFLDLLFARIGKTYIEPYLRMLPQKLPRNNRHQVRHDDLGASNSHFSRAWIGQVCDSANSLPHVIEYIYPALKKGSPVRRQLDTPRPAIQQLHRQCVLKAQHCLGNHWGGNPQFGCGFGHAPGISYCHEDM
ncbi:MAG TPA: hypothetical protein VJV58_02605 [Bradyrhizobium sp.]|nr:hypothetical protein [Bradyrhizobium sp.]HKO69803.1 hypothetical protein [Bradyrhizobium sp.]